MPLGKEDVVGKTPAASGEGHGARVNGGSAADGNDSGSFHLGQESERAVGRPASAARASERERRHITWPWSSATGVVRLEHTYMHTNIHTDTRVHSPASSTWAFL